MMFLIFKITLINIMKYFKYYLFCQSFKYYLYKIIIINNFHNNSYSSDKTNPVLDSDS